MTASETAIGAAPAPAEPDPVEPDPVEPNSVEAGLAKAGIAEADDDAVEMSGPQRRCIVTGTVTDRAALLRFAVAPGGEIVPDVAARLPGRGLWLTPRRDIVERALAKRLFARAARRPVTAPADLADRIEVLLARRCCEAISLSRRAGRAVAGFEKVREALRAGKGGLLLSAADGAEGGRDKLRALGRDLPVLATLNAAELGAAFGRDHIVHALLGAGPLCARLIGDAERLAGFRTLPADGPGTNSASAQQDGGTESR